VHQSRARGHDFVFRKQTITKHRFTRILPHVAMTLLALSAALKLFSAQG
jgi:uncharacterized membrane protein SirB2